MILCYGNNRGKRNGRSSRHAYRELSRLLYCETTDLKYVTPQYPEEMQEAIFTVLGDLERPLEPPFVLVGHQDDTALPQAGPMANRSATLPGQQKLHPRMKWVRRSKTCLDRQFRFCFARHR